MIKLLPYVENCYFEVAGLFQSDSMFFDVHDRLKDISQKIPNFNIYGSPDCSWNSGRLCIGIMTELKIRSEIQNANQRKLGVSFVASNFLLKKDNF